MMCDDLIWSDMLYWSLRRTSKILAIGVSLLFWLTFLLVLFFAYTTTSTIVLFLMVIFLFVFSPYPHFYSHALLLPSYLFVEFFLFARFLFYCFYFSFHVSFRKLLINRFWMKVAASWQKIIVLFNELFSRQTMSNNCCYFCCCCCCCYLRIVL